jgi:hypothetical protein
VHGIPGAQVSANLILFFAAAAEFEDSRLELRNYRHVLDELVRCLFYPQTPNLVEASLKVCYATKPPACDQLVASSFWPHISAGREGSLHS